MATVYVRSTDGDNGDDGSTWALADATLAASLTAAGAGGRSYVSDVHAESQASAMTLTSPGTAASPTEVVCGDDVAEPPTAVATTGSVTTTGANGINFAGYAYVYGLTFNCGTGGTLARMNFTSGSWGWTFENCALNIVHTAADESLVVGPISSPNPGLLRLINTNISFAAVGQSVRTNTSMEWLGGALAAGAAIPTTLFSPNVATAAGAHVKVSGVDLSLAGAGKNLVDVSPESRFRFVFENCKLGASVAITTGSFAAPGSSVELVNCDSGDTNYRYYFACYQGTVTHETTIVRTSGGSDGTTPLARKLVTSANSKFHIPLECVLPAVWNETVGSSITVEVEVVTDGVTLTDAEAWLSVRYQGTSGVPLASFADDRKADILATPANQTTSVVAWTTTGLSSPVKQKLSVTFTPQEKGWVFPTLCLAKASTTLYSDFKATVS